MCLFKVLLSVLIAVHGSPCLGYNEGISKFVKQDICYDFIGEITNRISMLKEICDAQCMILCHSTKGCSLSVCMNDVKCVLGKFDLHCLLRKGKTYNYPPCLSPHGMKMWVSYERYQYQIEGSCEKYAPHQNYEQCEDNEEVDVRDGCNLKQDCLFNARNICDKNSTCFGIAWLKDDLEQKIVVCLSRKMIATENKWQTILKV